MKQLAVLLVVLAAGCTGEGGQAVGSRSDGRQATDGQPRKMSSLRVNGVDDERAAETPSATVPAPGTPSSGRREASQSMTLRGGATGIQIPGGSNNAQSMNVQASGGTVTQRQNGSGNSQSMNIGVTDDVATGNGVSVKP